MKPETAAFLQKSREFLGKAQGMLNNQWPDEAGRPAYLAGLHAAKPSFLRAPARRSRATRGCRENLGVKDDPRVDKELRAFLGRAYNLKALADYETGPGSQVSTESAREAIQTAHRFVACVAGLIPANGHTLAPHTPQP